MVEEIIIKEISILDVKMILAALEYHALENEKEGASSFMFAKRNKDKKDLQDLKKKIENMQSGSETIKDMVKEYEKNLVNKVAKGRSEKEIKDMFMYLSEEDIRSLL